MNIPTTDYPALIEIINQTYTSGLNAILAAKMVGKNKMLVLGQDGSKQLAIELSPQNIAIKWINSGQKPPKKGAESFSEVSLDDALLNAAVVSMAQLAGIDLPISFSEAPVLDCEEEYAEGKAFKCSPKSISCKGRCISGWKVCREGLNPAQIKMVDKLLKSLKAEKAAGIEDGKAAKGLGFVQQVTAKMQELKADGKDYSFDLAVEALTPKFEPSKEEVKAPEKKPSKAVSGAVKAAAAKMTKSKPIKTPPVAPPPSAVPKTEKELVQMAKNTLLKVNGPIQKHGLSLSEARAIQSWAMSSSFTHKGEVYNRYKAMNRMLHDPDSIPDTLKPQLQALNELASRAYAKVPSITVKDVNEKLPTYQKIDEKDPPPLIRNIGGMKPEVVAAIVKAHKDAIGGEIIKPEHFATSHKKNGIAFTYPQVSFKIKAKWDGTGQGKDLEQYKNSGEREVMFPPGSRFRVVAVNAPEPTKLGSKTFEKVTIELEEI
jgi:hypothetical protein